MSFFSEDMFSSENIGTTLLGAATGALAGAALGPQGIAAGAVLGAASAGQASRMQRKQEVAQEDAAKTAKLEAQQRRNALIEEEFKKKKKGVGTGMKAPGQQAASNQGTVLTSSAGSQQTTSILGGS